MTKKLLKAHGEIDSMIPAPERHKVFISAHLRDSEQGLLNRIREDVKLEIDKRIYDHLMKKFMKKYHHERIPGKDNFDIEISFIYKN